MRPFDAVIFDLDGTLLDTERLVVEAGLAAFDRLGLPRRPDLLHAMIGTVGDDASRRLAEACGPDFDAAAFDAAVHAGFVTGMAAGIALRPGVHDLLDMLGTMGLPYAVATNSTTASAVTNMAAAGLGARFDAAHIHGRDRVVHPKPAPDLFLHAAQGLGVAPVRCIVFEDSDTGVTGALAAGMTVVHVPDLRPAAHRSAHVIADSLMAGARAAGLIA